MPIVVPMTPPMKQIVTGLGEKLGADIFWPRADRNSQSDLARAFGDRHQHHIHNADAAHQQLIAATEASSKVRVRVVSVITLITSVWLRIVKSSGASGGRR